MRELADLFGMIMETALQSPLTRCRCFPDLPLRAGCVMVAGPNLGGRSLFVTITSGALQTTAVLDRGARVTVFDRHLFRRGETMVTLTAVAA